VYYYYAYEFADSEGKKIRSSSSSSKSLQNNNNREKTEKTEKKQKKQQQHKKSLKGRDLLETISISIYIYMVC
jgi:hypothetical protein